jgi:hypothetical protein
VSIFVTEEAEEREVSSAARADVCFSLLLLGPLVFSPSSLAPPRKKKLSLQEQDALRPLAQLEQPGHRSPGPGSGELTKGWRGERGRKREERASKREKAPQRSLCPPPPLYAPKMLEKQHQDVGSTADKLKEYVLTKFLQLIA